MSKVCLDTSAYSHFKRGDEAVIGIIDAADWVGVPAIVLGELRAGFAHSRSIHQVGSTVLPTRS